MGQVRRRNYEHFIDIAAIGIRSVPLFYYTLYLLWLARHHGHKFDISELRSSQECLSSCSLLHYCFSVESVSVKSDDEGMMKVIDKQLVITVWFVATMRLRWRHVVHFY